MNTENKNPFVIGSVAWSKWESEREREYLHHRTIALLEGRLPVVDQKDIDYLRDMGGVRGDKAGWPKRWTICARCHSEWQATGFPAPRIPGYNFAFAANRLGDWLFPGICECCDSELHSIKAPPSAAMKITKSRTPYAEEEAP